MLNCSLQRRMLMVLIALMLLPVVSAFAWNNSFTVHVTAGATPVPGATVFAWDKSNPFTNAQGVTDANGSATLILSGLTPTADSLTNPSPNVGFLAIPDNQTNSTSLAFATAETLFYNFWGSDAMAPDMTIMLDEGCALTVSPKLVDGAVTTAGVASALQVSLPGVPWQVKTFTFGVADFSQANPSWQIVWPFNTSFSYSLSGDDDYGYYDRPSYYSWKSDSIQVGNETAKTIELDHGRQYKGRYTLDTGNNTTLFDLAWTQASDVNFSYATVNQFVGSATIFVPRGLYNVKFIPEPLLNGIRPAISVFPAVNVGDQPVVQNVTVTGGSAITGQVTLANNGNPSAFSSLRVSAQKKVDFGGYTSWLEVESVFPSLMDGTYAFNHRLVNGDEYRIVTLNSNPGDNLPGIVDHASTPKKCYSHHAGELLTPSGDQVYNIALPQAAAVDISLTVINPTANGSFAKDTNNNPIPANLVYLPTADSNYGSTVPNVWQSLDNGNIFVPFIDVERHFFVRLSYDEDTTSSENPICNKVSAPFIGEAGITKAISLSINPLNFETVTSNLYIGVAGHAVTSGSARALFTPLIPFNSRLYSAAELVSSWVNSGYGLDNKVFTPQDAAPFIFKAEKGSTFRLSAVEETSPLGLEGFIPYSDDIAVPSDSTGGMNADIIVAEGRSFIGEVKVDGAVLAGQQIALKINSIFEEEFSYNGGQQFISRQGNVTLDANGMFRVSGLNPGRYEVEIILNGFDTSNINYHAQSMPFIRREIYVDENATANLGMPPALPSGTIINFALNTSAIGWLDAQIVDEKGQPVPNARVEIRRQGRVETDSYMGMSYYMQGANVFYCSTDFDGKIVRAAMPDQSQMIPLENGMYDIYVAGIDNPTASFTYQFSSNDQRPLATVQIYANNQRTPARVILQRKFPVSGTVKEDGQPVQYVGCQVMDMTGKSLEYFMVSQAGEFALPDGLVPGPVQIGMIVERDNARRFYLYQTNIVADQENVLNIELQSTSLSQVPILTVDSEGLPLGEAPGSVYLFSNPELTFRAPHWYITHIQSDLNGRINLSLPQLTDVQAQAGFAYGFMGHQKWVSVVDPSNSQNTTSKTFTPPPMTILTVPSTTPTQLVWKAPAVVTVTVSNVPAGREAKYLGVLITRSSFMAGQQTMDYPHKTPMPGTGETRDAFFAGLKGNQFVFENVVPGQEYVFAAYEAFNYLDPEMLRWSMEFPADAMFRHVSAPFLVETDLTRTEALSSLASLNIICSQAPEVLARPGAVSIAFTPDSVSTVGNVSWPFIATSRMYGEPSPLITPIEVPVNYALRISFIPSDFDGFLSKVYENFAVPAAGRTLDLVLNELPKVTGSVTFDGQPMMGQLILVPEGADAMSEEFEPTRVRVYEGNFSAYLKPGFYNGYAVPAMGAAKYLEIAMASVSQTLSPIAIPRGIPVRGTVTSNAAPLFGSSILVMRKSSAISDLTDGKKLFPYPAMMGDFEIPCGPAGEFFFPAEDNVDYYIQPIVPAGFNPGLPVKVSVRGTPVEKNIIVGEGGLLKGSINVAGYVEAKPVGNSVLGGQFGTSNGFFADASIPNNSGRFDFTFVGLDPAMRYDITFWPMEFGYSYKKLSNVAVPVNPDTAPLLVDLSAGYKITGQLVDSAGLPLNAAGISVNLAMTLASQELATPAPSVNANFKVRQTIAAPTSADYSMQDAMLSGMWTQTNEYGQFTFNNVPEFLIAFIRTENGFSIEGVNYGRSRTDNFVPAFVNDMMEMELKVPVGGRIIGRLIDEAGKPVVYANIDANMGQEWANAMVKEDGSFAIEGLAPGANYMVQLMEMPGFVPVFRSGILVEPGKTTDLGSIVVAKAVMAFGLASGTQALMQRSFAYGVPENDGIGIFAVDGNRALTDDDLLTGRYMQSITGESELYLDPNMLIDEIGFSMFAKPGKNHIGAILHRESDDGVQTLVTWGWKSGLVIPTQEQLAYGAFDLSSGSAPIIFPQKFGVIEGTLKHAVDAAVVFNPNDAAIALYPVVASGAEFILRPTPFPAAITSPVNGRWLIRDVPQGTYRIKVITSRFGAQFMTKVITIGDTLVKEDLALGTSVRRVTGKVLLSGTTNPVASAKVSLIMNNLSTSTDATGNFSFYLPVNELLLPQIEIAKPGIQTTRILAAGGIATAGIVLTADQDLGNLEVSGSVGSVEVTVKSAKDNNIYVGAEVALVYKESLTNPVWTVGEIQTTDENGKARFLSVPTGREVSFRARAHYHVPQISSVTVNGDATALTITMQPAMPKVFYTGMVEPHATDPSLLNLKAVFDFNQVVVKTNVGLKISDEDRLADCLFPDLIGGRITNMMFNDTVPNEDNLVASVTYSGSEIGRFNILGNALFRREYEVDPLAQNGFTGRQTDSDGNTLPTGIAVPPGYLDPTIDSFNLEVASPTIDPADKVEGSDDAPEFAGPAFSFTFGQGESNFGAGNHQGLFEITIAYSEGTQLEPRWYDTEKKIWSKVGIIQDSIRYDYPQKGYVTFKVDHLTEFSILKNVVGAASGLRCDFNNDGAVNLSDVVYMLAWYQLSAANRTEANVKTRAQAILPSVTGSVVYMPNTAIDDVNGDGAVNLSDVVMALAWYQLSVANRTESGVLSRATSILASVTGTVTAMPGVQVTR